LVRVHANRKRQQATCRRKTPTPASVMGEAELLISEGLYNVWMVAGHKFSISRQYELDRAVGQGSYGV
jgi:hypothetical protein